MIDDRDDRPNQRGKAIAEAKKREMDKRRFQRKTVHKKKVTVMLDVEQQPPTIDPSIEMPKGVRGALYDVSEGGVSIFSNIPFLPNARVNITIEYNPPFSIKGRVVWSQKHDTGSHIISANSNNFRTGVEFQFENPAQRATVSKFFKSLDEPAI